MDFGKTADGKPVELYTLTNGKVTAKVMTYGAILTELDVPDRDGKPADVVLGFDDLKGYLAGHPYFGATVGRFANRIARGEFTLDGKTYTLAKNNGPNTLHGGLKGFDKVVWDAEELSTTDGPSVRFSYLSPDGEEGLPRQPQDDRHLHPHGRPTPSRSTTPPRPTRPRPSTSRTTAISTSPAPRRGRSTGTRS